MKTLTFVFAQLAIFASVKIPLHFTPLNGFQGDNWSWAFAYGSLFFLPFFLNLRNIKVLIPVLMVCCAWCYSMYFKLNPWEFSDVYIPLIYGSIAVVAVPCGRPLMVLGCVVVMCYAAKLAGIETPTDQQLGLFNLMFGILYFESQIEHEANETTPPLSREEEYREAA